MQDDSDDEETLDVEEAYEHKVCWKKGFLCVIHKYYHDSSYHCQCRKPYILCQ